MSRSSPHREGGRLIEIVDCEAWSVAVPFRNPIESAYGVSYPARVRTVVRLTADDGSTGIGETGPSAVHRFHRDDLAPRFLREVAPAVLGADPRRSEDLLARLGWNGDAVAVEIACWDLVARSYGVPVAELLGGRSLPDTLPVAAYAFFRAPDEHGRGAVTPDGMVDAVRELVAEHGFSSIKIKTGVYDPATEIEVTRAVREAFPQAPLRIDPNGAWSVATALRAMRQLEELDLEFIEDPIKDSPLGVPQEILTGRTVDIDGFRRLRAATRTPLCADNCYRLDLLRQLIRHEAADVVLADVFGCGGLRATVRWLQTADLFHLGLGMHSGTELGIGQLAKLHAMAAVGDRLGHASDAIYPEYVDDVLAGGKLEIRDGHMAVPTAPGLGRELDEDRLARWELTAERHRDLDQRWDDLLAERGIGGGAQASMLVRGY